MFFGPGCLLGPYSSSGVGVTWPKAVIRGYGLMMQLKAGDRAPDLVIDLSGADGPADLTAATSVRVLGARAGVTIIDRPVVGTAQGELRMSLQAGDTTPGVAGFEVGKPLTPGPSWPA